MQIALIMLVGFVGEERYLDRRVRFGTSSYGYEYHMGCRIRSRRPFASVLMTSLAMVVGLRTYDVAFGVGAHGNRTLHSGYRRYVHRYDLPDLYCSGFVRSIPVLTGEIQADRMGRFG